MGDFDWKASAVGRGVVQAFCRDEAVLVTVGSIGR